MEQGYTETQAYNQLYSGGLTIKSTQDLAIQQICDEVVADESLYPMTEYGVEYALTIHRADGTAENYSKRRLSAAYISNTYADSNPLVFSSEEEARAMVEEYKGTLGINTEAGDIVDENLSSDSPAPDFCRCHGSVHRTGQSDRRRARYRRPQASP